MRAHCVRERRVIPGYSLLLVCVLPLPSAHEAAGAKGIRRSPRPRRAEDSSTARALRAARVKSYPEFFVIASGAKQSIFLLQRHGLLRCARNDDSTNRIVLGCLKIESVPPDTV